MRHKDLPACESAEAAVVGSMLDTIDDNIPLVIAHLGESESVFYNNTCREWFKTICDMYRRKEFIRFDTVVKKMEMMGKPQALWGGAEAYKIAKEATISEYIPQYSAQILDCHSRRCAIQSFRVATTRLHDMTEPIDEIRTQIEDSIFNAFTSDAREKPESISGLASAEVKRLIEIDQHTHHAGVRTGIDTLDDVVLPLRAGNYMIIAARPSVGKTTIGCNIALNAAREGASVLFFSLEMTKAEMANKFVQIASGVNTAGIERSRGCMKTHQDHLLEAERELQHRKIHIDDKSMTTPGEMKSKAKLIRSRHGLDLVIIDYIQLMDVKGSESRNVAVSSISREIKAMAKELGVPVIVLAQLSREGDARPELKHLRESGSLEQDCDIAVLLWRNGDVNQRYITAIVAKQRSGPVGEACVFFDRERQLFLAVDHDGRPVEYAPKRNDDWDPMPELSYTEEDDTPF